MILVDTSVWIELLSGKLRHSVRQEDLLRFATCGPVLQEVFQGLRDVPATEEFRRRAAAAIFRAITRFARGDAAAMGLPGPGLAD